MLAACSRTHKALEAARSITCGLGVGIAEEGRLGAVALVVRVAAASGARRVVQREEVGHLRRPHAHAGPPMY